MERNLVQYTPSELVSMLEDGFSQIYRPFANYQLHHHTLWQNCVDTLLEQNALTHIIFCNDVIKIPPAKVFLCLRPVVSEDKNLNACDKKFIGSFWSYLFYNSIPLQIQKAGWYQQSLHENGPIFLRML